MIRFETDLIDESTLLTPEHVACATDVEIAHGDVESTSEFVELFHGLQPHSRFSRQSVDRLDEEVAERLPIRPTNPPAQDRKSTRLNSSHVAISYAVFCL